MARRYQNRLLDVSGGMRSGVSEYGLRPNFLALAQNVEFRPVRAASVRKGSQILSSGTLTKQPRSILEWVGTAGGGAKKFVYCTGGYLYEMDGTAFTAQTPPYALNIDARASWTQLNGALFVTEDAGSNEPMFFRASNAANTFLSMTYPTPNLSTATITTPAAATALPAATYYYRLRHVFEDGSSPPSAAVAVTLAAGDKVVFANIPVSPAGRTDYVGWILERTFQSGASTGPFFLVSDGTANSHEDTLEDGDLGEQADDLYFGGIPDGHVRGIIAFNDRLAAWSGSTLYVSQSTSDLFGSGICNWNAENGYDFGRDDGEDITCVVKQSDRLLVFKSQSVWALEGNDPSNFTVTHLYQGAGAAGPRCAASMGQRAWFFGAAGLHLVNGNSIGPFGYDDIGDELDAVTSSRIDEAVLLNHSGQRLYLWFSNDAVSNNVMLVFDIRYGRWSKWTNWYAQDAIVQKSVQFGDASSFLFVDGRDRDADPVNEEYRAYIGYFGEKDEKAVGGAGGTSIPVVVEFPWLDDGMPDVYKSLERIELYARGSGLTVNIKVDTDPSLAIGSIPVDLATSAALWDAFNWGDSTLWAASSSESSKASGIMEGMYCRRYKLTVSASVPVDFIFKGLVVDVVVQPERRYS